MASLSQAARPLGQQQNAMATQPPGGFDIMQLLQMLMQGQQSQQQNLLDFAGQKPSNIAQSVNNQRPGLDSWYNMNPQALQGESYDQSRAAQVQQNQVTRQQQGLNQRIGLAGLLNQLAGQQNDFVNTFQGDFGRLPVNPFIGL